VLKKVEEIKISEVADVISMKLILKKISNARKTILLYSILILCVILSLIFVNHNYKFYKKTIGQVIIVQEVEQTKTGNQDDVFHQKLTVIIKNGVFQGERLVLENEYTYTRAYDNQYKTGDKLFMNLDSSGQTLAGSITGVKRDQYLVLMAWIFIILIIVVGRLKGLFSVLSLAFNITLFSFALDLYRKGMNLLFICSLIAIVFTVCSLFLVSGNNRKTYAAILATLIGTFSSLLIALLVMFLTKEEGIRYEEMQFITHPPYEIFMAEILVGSLGAIMDISITMSSSIYELVQKNSEISSKALIASGMEIGKDIMGTMINVLFFAYVSGSIPMILLYIKNGSSIFYSFYTNLSLELVRALTGSIGIVITIPIALYISIFIIHTKRAAA
jgi:uncharacterized membrane protein